MGSWEGIMGRVTDATRLGGKETKFTSQKKEGVPYDRMGKNVRKTYKCPT